MEWVVGGLLQEGGRERVEGQGMVVGKGAEKGHTEASVCMSRSLIIHQLSRPQTLTSLSDSY